MKTFAITIPKAGTYLMRELLEQIGLKGSYLHISERGTNDYSKVTLEHGRKNPHVCFKKMTLEESLNNIPENSFAVGHLGYSPHTANLLSTFNVILLKRDFKETILSRMLFLLQTGRGNRQKESKFWVNEQNHQTQFLKYIKTNGDNLAEQYSKILLWEDSDNVECFDFNMIKSSPTEQVQRLAKIHHFELTKTEIEQIIDISFNKDTLTKSIPVDKDKYWCEKTHNKLDGLIKKYKIG